MERLMLGLIIVVGICRKGLCVFKFYLVKENVNCIFSMAILLMLLSNFNG